MRLSVRPPVAVQVSCSTSPESFAAWSVRGALEKVLRRVEG